MERVILKKFFLTCMITYSFSQQSDFPKLTGPYLGQKTPGLSPEIFAPGIVSTDLYNHCSVAISPDGTEIYWAMAPKDTPRRIYFSKMTDGFWTQPEILSFTITEDGDCPVLSPDGKKLFFNSSRRMSGETSRRERIWYAERKPEGWGNPFPLGPEINGEHLHWQLSVNYDGDLFFGSERKGSKGKDDIFKAGYLNGTFRKPVSLSSEINSAEHESTPFIAPDGSYLIFSRNGLWISFRKDNNTWTNAISMGNACDGACPYVSPDGKYIFFLKMGMGYNDVWWVDAQIIEKLKNDQVKKT